MDIVDSVAKGIIIGFIMFCLVSIADNLQTIKENEKNNCVCEVKD